MCNRQASVVEVIRSSGRLITVRELTSKLREEPRWEELLNQEGGMKQARATVWKVAKPQGAGPNKRLVLRKITTLHERLLEAVKEEEKEARKVWLAVDRVVGGPSAYLARPQARS